MKLLEYKFEQECDAKVLERTLAEKELQKVRAMKQNQLETSKKLLERIELEKAEFKQALFEETFLRKEIETILDNERVSSQEALQKITKNCAWKKLCSLR